jgi:hypothetical protein
MALAAGQPSDGPETVRHLRSLRMEGGRQKTPPVGRIFGLAGVNVQRAATLTEPVPEDLRDLDFGQRLEALISDVATAKVRGADAELAAWRGFNITVTMAPTVRMAWISWSLPDGNGNEPTHYSDEFAPAQRTLALAAVLMGPRAPLRRTTSFNFALLETAADLLADTLRRQQGGLISGPDASGTPENKEPGPNGDRALTETSRPILSDGTSSHPEANGSDDSAQYLSRVDDPLRAAGRIPKHGATRCDRSYSAEPVAA